MAFLRAKKILIATAGLASVSYLGCDDNTNITSGNLPAPPQCDGGGYACYSTPDAGNDARSLADANVGNLMAPPDAGLFVDASDAAVDAPADGEAGAADAGHD